MNQFDCFLLLAAPVDPDDWLNIASASFGVSGLVATLLAVFVFHSLILGILGSVACLAGLIIGIFGVRRLSGFGSQKRNRRLRRLGRLGIITSSLVLGGWLLIVLLLLLLADPQE